MVSLPPHTSHRMQPLDLTFMKPLSSYMTAEINKMQRGLKGKSISIKKIFPIFGRAFSKAATMESAQNGFRKAGLVPLNPDIFTDAEFKSSEDINNDSENETSAENENVGLSAENILISQLQEEDLLSNEDLDFVDKDNEVQHLLDEGSESLSTSKLSALNVEPSEKTSRSGNEALVPSDQGHLDVHSKCQKDFPQSPATAPQTQPEFQKALRNIKKEFCGTVIAPKRCSPKGQTVVVEEVDLTISDVIPPGAVPISSVATGADETVSIDLSQEHDQTSSLAGLQISCNPTISTSKQSKRRASEKIAVDGSAKKAVKVRQWS